MRLSDSTSSFLSSKRRNSESKLAHLHEQSEFTHSGSLVAAGHLEPQFEVVVPQELAHDVELLMVKQGQEMIRISVLFKGTLQILMTRYG